MWLFSKLRLVETTMHGFILAISLLPLSLRFCFRRSSFGFSFLIPLQLSFPLFLKVRQSFLLLLLFFSLPPRKNLSASISLVMSLLVHHLHEVTAGRALVSLATTKIIMVIVINELDGLLAELAGSWLLGALLGMVSVLILFSRECTIFTGYTRVFFFIMLLFLAFGNASATLLASVVLP